MTLTEACGMFDIFQEHRGADTNLLDVTPDYAWPVFCTAYASLSGQLSDCNEPDDLVEAVNHCKSLEDAGVITREQVNDEVHRICKMVTDKIKFEDNFEWN